MTETLPPKPLPVGYVALAALVMGLAANYLFFDKAVGISFFVFVVLYQGLLFGIAHAFRYEYHPKAWWFVPGILFFSFMVAVRSNGFLTFINVVATLGLCLLQVQFLAGENVARFALVDFITKFFTTGFGFIGKAFSAAGELTRLKNTEGPAGRNKQIVRGTLISLPILILFIILFASADMVFGKYVKEIFSLKFSAELVGRFVFLCVMAFAFLGIFAYVLSRATKTLSERPASPQTAPSGFGVIESSILLGSLCVLFLLFILVQIRYLFAGQDAITHLGYTYAQYAHKGFGELSFAAVFTFLIVYVLQKHAGSRPEGTGAWFKVLTSVLLFETFVVLYSGFKRLSLYESAYGFTSLRLYSHMFVVWLGVVFVLLWYKVLSGSKSSVLAFEGMLSVFAFLAVLNFLNPDAFIVNQNLQRYGQNGKLDADYISSLSADAAGAVQPLLNSGDSTLKNSALGYFAWQLRQNRVGKASGDWQSFNFAKNKTNAVTKSNQEIQDTYFDQWGSGGVEAD